MSYKSVVEGLISVLKTIPDFTGGGITANDYRVLNSGLSQCIVLCPGGFRNELATVGGIHSEFWVDWDVNIELYVRYDTTDDIVAQRISTYRELIIEAVAKYPFLNGTENVILARVVRGEKPIPVFRPNGEGPIFWMQPILLTAREDLSDITALE